MDTQPNQTMPSQPPMPPQEQKKNHHLTILGWILLAIIVVGVVVLVGFVVLKPAPEKVSQLEAVREETSPQEWEDVTIFPESIDFMYTSEGFNSENTIGDTETVVKFTNNTDTPLRIIFPSVENLEIPELAPGEEITLLPFEVGIHEFQNASDPSQGGNIEIE